MLFNTSEIAISGHFNGPAGFRTEMAKHCLPIQPSRKVNGSNMYGSADFAIATVIGRLRGWGGQKISTPAAARFCEQIDRETLAIAIAQLEAGEITDLFICLPSWGEELEGFTCVFTSADDVAAALADTDLIVIEVGAILTEKLKEYS